MDVHYAEIAVEMYEDGWTLRQLADFFNAAGLPSATGRPWSMGSWKAVFRRAGVEMRPRGRPRKIAAQSGKNVIRPL